MRTYRIENHDKDEEFYVDALSPLGAGEKALLELKDMGDIPSQEVLFTILGGDILSLLRGYGWYIYEVKEVI